MPKVEAYVTTDDQLRAAVRAVRAVLPIAKKMVMAKLTNDYATELICASILLPKIAKMRMLHNEELSERIEKALREAILTIDKLGTNYHCMTGSNFSIAVANIAERTLETY